MMDPAGTNLLMSLFIFCLGLSFILDQSGYFKQLYQDWKAKRKSHTLAKNWPRDDIGEETQESIPEGDCRNIASHPPTSPFHPFSFLLL